MAQVNIDVAKEESVQAVNTKVGTSSDTASSTPTTVFAGIKGLIAWFTGTWTAARAGKLDNIQATLNTPNGNTLASWIEYLQIKSDLSVNLLSNATYGLSALKTALTGATKKVQSGKIPASTPQTGYLTYATAQGTQYLRYVDVNINSVDTTKSHCFSQYAIGYARRTACELISSTVLRVYFTYSNNTSVQITDADLIFWQVIEN